MDGRTDGGRTGERAGDVRAGGRQVVGVRWKGVRLILSHHRYLFDLCSCLVYCKHTLRNVAYHSRFPSLFCANAGPIH